MKSNSICRVGGSIHRFIAPALIALLSGYGMAQDAESPQPAPRPTAAQLQEATHPGYATPAGIKLECLGRLVFDAPREMQWGISVPGLFSGDRYRFSETLHGGHDDLWVGNMQVVVVAPAKREHIQQMFNHVGIEMRLAIRTYKTSIETEKGIIEDLQRLLDDPSKNINNVDLSKYPQKIAYWQKEIADTEAEIAGLQRDWHPLDLGLPDALGYVAGPTFYAFLLRDGRAYKFMDDVGDEEKAPPFEVRQKNFIDTIKRFKARKLYEIPKERGICVPYGFIPDDGTLGVRLEVSLRYADRPGVIYTLGTGIVDENGINGAESSALKAVARAGGAGIDTLASGHDVKRIGPKRAYIGALAAEQGGISMNVADPGKPVVNGYSVYTGYGGWSHSRVLPYITVDMRSFTKEQQPSLKVNPPPVEESLTRLDQLLKSIRLRPSEPAMPELIEAKKTAVR